MEVWTELTQPNLLENSGDTSIHGTVTGANIPAPLANVAATNNTATTNGTKMLHNLYQNATLSGGVRSLNESEGAVTLLYLMYHFNFGLIDILDWHYHLLLFNIMKSKLL